jgi:hypothetical protein
MSAEQDRYRIHTILPGRNLSIVEFLTGPGSRGSHPGVEEQDLRKNSGAAGFIVGAWEINCPVIIPGSNET